MSKGNNPDIAWLADVADNNYPAAESYLRLLFSEADALSRINQLRTVKIVRKRPAVPPVVFLAACGRQLPVTPLHRMAVDAALRPVGRKTRTAVEGQLPTANHENSVAACGPGAANSIGNRRSGASTAGSDWKQSFTFLGYRLPPTHCGSTGFLAE